MGGLWRKGLLLAGLAAVLAAPGCGARDGGRSVGGAAGQQQDGAVRPEEPSRNGVVGDRTKIAGDDLQSRKDKELVLTFGALLQMDRKPELALTSAQAAALLPLVKAGKDKGELSPEDEQAVARTLTADQISFITELRNRVGEQRKKLQQLTPEERAAMIERFKQHRKQEDSGAKADGSGSGSAADTEAGRVFEGGLGRNGGAGVRNGERTVEQQLLDLLEARLGQRAAAPRQ